MSSQLLVCAILAGVVAVLASPATVRGQGGRGREASAMGASWSPDGSRVVFSSDRDGTFQIYETDREGRETRRLTDVEGTHFFYPHYSPDGERIILMSYESEERAAIWVMSADGTGLRRITPADAFNAHPRYSPDGRRIVFESARDGNGEIYVMDADGGNATRLTERRTRDTTPVYSPDGKRIVFAARGLERASLWMMDADGANQHRLTDNPGAQDLHPAFSPDGATIAFHRVERFRDPLSPRPRHTSQIFILDVATGEATQLTRGAGFKYEAAYSPDGELIAFTWRRRHKEVWVMTSEGTRPRQLTRSNPG